MALRCRSARSDDRGLGAVCQHRGPLEILLVQTERDNSTENKPTLVKVQKKTLTAAFSLHELEVKETCEGQSGGAETALGFIRVRMMTWGSPIFVTYPVHTWMYLCVLQCSKKVLLPRWDALSDVGTESATKSPLSPPLPHRHDSGPATETMSPAPKQEDGPVFLTSVTEKLGGNLKTHICLLRRFFAWQFETNSAWSRCVILSHHAERTALKITGENNHLRFTESPGSSLCSTQTLAEGCEVPPVWNIPPFHFCLPKSWECLGSGWRFSPLAMERQAGLSSP